MNARARAATNLRAIWSSQAELNAFITITPDQASTDAKRVDRARERGRPLPLDGMLVGVKDNIDVGGVITTVGGDAYLKRYAASDADVVRRLRQAGGVIVGKTMLDELSFGLRSASRIYGVCRNPRDRERIPGGSSGGSAAAVAAGLCDAAIGTDTGGSIRIPAALTGVVGVRPTIGAVSTRGIEAVCRRFDVVGPLARTVNDAARLLLAIVKPTHTSGMRKALSGSSNCHHIDGVRIGIPGGFFFHGLDSDVAQSVESAIALLTDLGGIAVTIEIRGAERALSIVNDLSSVELAVRHPHLLKLPENIPENLRHALERGAYLAAHGYSELEREMSAIRRTVRALLHTVDVVVSPTCRIPAPLIGKMSSRVAEALTSLNAMWSLCGTPAMSLPCGITQEGLPIGLQVAAGPWREEVIFRVAGAYEETTNWTELLRP